MAEQSGISLPATEAAGPGEPPTQHATPQPASLEKAVPATQRTVDKLVLAALGWALPSWLRPNHLTVLRLVLIPAVLVLLYFEHRWWAFGVFAAAISTDFVDGALARRRHQISTFGVYVDPIADKLLVGAVLAWIGYRELVVQIFLAFIALELILTAVGASILLRTGASNPSNVFGKAKMIVQSLALVLFLIAGIFDLGRLRDASLWLLWLALALAVVSGARQIIDVLRKKTRPA